MKNALITSTILQILMGLIMSGILDGGDCFRMWMFSEAVYLPVLAYVLIRRWSRITKTDTAFIAVGIIPVFALTAFIVGRG